LTNVFEHATKIINYAFCENIGDGRGYTCGSVGFSTGTSNALTVIEEYRSRGGKSELFQYIPELQRLATSNDCSVPRGDISKLKGFPEIWQKDSCQILFRTVQDEMADYLFFLPSMKIASDVGIKTNLGKAIFY
ncbi:lysozyme-like protein, partial [Basidiobolus meristosporus CBS 931.73]